MMLKDVALVYSENVSFSNTCSNRNGHLFCKANLYWGYGAENYPENNVGSLG
jgi:hypothetical protein